MKNKILIICTICIMIISFGFTVKGEQPPAMPQGEIPHGEMPPNQMSQSQPPQGGRGQMPPDTNGNIPEGEGSSQTDEANLSKDTLQPQQPEDTETQQPDTTTENGMNPGEFNPENMGKFPFGQQGMETQQEPEKPYEKWITPIISAVVMIFGFVFVALYKRKQY